eukprot:1014574-Pleurochrysis_carterae.AAC.1
MQTDGSPPASDRLKSFTLDKNELAKLLALKLADLHLINFGIFVAEASRRGKLMVMTNLERCHKSGEYLLELARFGHRLTVGSGWSPTTARASPPPTTARASPTAPSSSSCITSTSW